EEAGVEGGVAHHLLAVGDEAVAPLRAGDAFTDDGFRLFPVPARGLCGDQPGDLVKLVAELLNLLERTHRRGGDVETREDGLKVFESDAVVRLARDRLGLHASVVEESREHRVLLGVTSIVSTPSVFPSGMVVCYLALVRL